MRQAERALFDLRRGLPILLRQPTGDTLVQAVEGLDVYDTGTDFTPFKTRV